jgi:outer membrane protein OmpA-like peptidoglycan-associated protein
MEQALGTDLGGVRVHTDAGAATAARDIKAEAFTHGQEIYFGAGRYQPGTTAGDQLLAHELTHTVQQQGSSAAVQGQLRISEPDEPLEREADAVASGIRSRGPVVQLSPQFGAHQLQRFVGTEHENLGNTTGIRQIDLGNGVILSWGQIVAIAGDYYENVEKLMDDASTLPGRARIRAALEHYSSPDVGLTNLPAATDVARGENETSYALLALKNIPHFSIGGTARETWRGYHERAIATAIHAGLNNDTTGLNRALIREAFGQHFLTDAFSAGHIRTPRREIDEWYVNTFAPRIFDHLIEYIRERFVVGLTAQIAPHTPWYLLDRFVRRRVRDRLDSKMRSGLDRVPGGRAGAIEWLGHAIGGAVAGAIHDIEGRKGLNVRSRQHPTPYRAYGDTALRDRPGETRIQADQARQAVLVAKEDIDQAFNIGQGEARTSRAVPLPDALPATAYFDFDRSDIRPDIATGLERASSYMIYHPESILQLVGHTDPTGTKDYNDDLARRRAERVAGFMTSHGVDPARITVESTGETAPVTTNPRQFWRNRKVTFSWSEQSTGVSRDIGYERASSSAKTLIGPPYLAEDWIPEPVPDMNDASPDWHWGSLPRPVRDELTNFVKEKVSQIAEKVLNVPDLAPQQIEGYNIQPRPIAQSILDAILANPVRFFEDATHESAGPTNDGGT